VELEDKLVLVTGGARRVGRAMGEALAGAGARPVVHYHRSEAEARDLARQTGGHCLQADLASSGAAARLAQEVLRLPGPLALWVNSADSFDRVPFLESTDAQWLRAMQLTLLSPMTCAREIAPHLAPGGIIINILDTAASQPWRGYAHHCVAKAALQMLTRALALELAPDVRVCGVCPGLVLPAEDMPHPLQERLLERIPLGRQGSPEDVARAVLFLAQNDYLTGNVINVDGGLNIACYLPPLPNPLPFRGEG